MQPRYARSHRPSPFSGIIAVVFILTLAGGAAMGARPLLEFAGAFAADIPSGAPGAGGDSGSSANPDQTAEPDSSVRPGGSGSPAPARTHRPARTPKPTPALDPPPRRGAFSMDIYRSGFVSEMEAIWCVPAAMMTMINIIDRRHQDTTRKTQKRLYDLGQKLSSKKLDGDGVEPEGWAETLNREGYGPYAVRVATTRKAAIHIAAKALRMTGKPVGLVTWRGAHSWVMSGFKATADPAWTDRFEVTDVWIEDVWYPRVSSIWGASSPPDTLVPFDRLYEDFLPFYRPTVKYPGKDGNFLVIEPLVKRQRR